jgi:hypothetical protein
MKLKAGYDNKDDIPEAHLELFAEKGGKWELVGIEGMKTQGDIDRIQEGLKKEKNDHKETKAKLADWRGMDPAEEIPKLDRIPELEAMAESKGIDDKHIEQIVQGRIKGIVGPIERERDTLRDAKVASDLEISEFKTRDKTRIITDAVRKSALDGKVVNTALDDVIMVAKSHFEINDSGEVITKGDIKGVTAGVDPQMWMQDMVLSRPHWFPSTTGGGSGGSDGKGGGFPGNPWSREHWNLTKQGQVVLTHGQEKADQMMKSAGSHVGATKPPEEKS